MIFRVDIVHVKAGKENVNVNTTNLSNQIAKRRQETDLKGKESDEQFTYISV